MTKVLRKNMLGVLLIVGVVVLMTALPVYGAEDVVTATSEIPAVVSVEAETEPTAMISQEDLMALKAALDGMEELIASLSAYVASLPTESNERLVFAKELSVTLGVMSTNLIALQRTLNVIDMTAGSNLAEVSTDPKEIVTAPIAQGEGKVMAPSETKVLAPSEENLLVNETGETNKATLAETGAISADEGAANGGTLSLIKESLNSLPGVIILLVFVIIFGLIVFMRASSGKEAQSMS